MSSISDSGTISTRSENSPRVHIVVLAILFVIGQFAMQVFLPAMPAIEAEFHVSANYIAMAVSLATVAFAVGSLAYGGLADKLGRRPTVLIGMALLTIGSVVNALAPNIGVLLVGRVIQSAGGAAGIVAGRAIVVDVYEGRTIVKTMSWMFAVMTVAPILATPLGGVIVDSFGWRGNFVTVAVIAALTVLVSFLFLSETRSDHHAAQAGLVKMLQGWGQLLKSKTYLGFVVNHALQMAANTTFLAAVGILLARLHGLSSTSIGFVYVVGGVMVGIGAYASTRLPENAYPLILGAAAVGAVASVVGVILAQSEVWNVAAIVLPAAIISCVFGFTGPAIQAGAVGAIPGMQAMASGMLMFVSSVVTAATIQLEAGLDDGTPVPLTAIMAACSVAALLSLVVAYRRRLAPANSPHS